MQKVKIHKNIFKKPYFFFLVKTIVILHKEGKIQLDYYNDRLFEEPFYELIYIDDFPVFIDLRDDFTVDKRLGHYYNDYMLLKANFSTELWNLAEKDNYPEGFEYRLKDWELKMRRKIKPFMLGRAFNPKDTEFSCHMNEDKIKYDIVSYNGTGLTELQNNTRFKLYDLIEESGLTSKLMYRHKSHDKNTYFPNENYYIQNYPYDTDISLYKDYVSFLQQGKFSINCAGIALSTPFRIVDSVLAKRKLISTKIWHDLYDTFPCIKLPICGYLGTGDWDEAKNILTNLEKYDTVQENHIKFWYSWFFSSEGMWRNQIMRWIK